MRCRTAGVELPRGGAQVTKVMVMKEGGEREGSGEWMGCTLGGLLITLDLLYKQCCSGACGMSEPNFLFSLHWGT